jgi:hypothetical protein
MNVMMSSSPARGREVRGVVAIIKIEPSRSALGIALYGAVMAVESI